MPSSGKDMEKQELSHVPVGTQNGAATLEDSLVISYKTTHTLTIGSSNRTPWYLLKWVEDYVHTKNAYSSFIHNC